MNLNKYHKIITKNQENLLNFLIPLKIMKEKAINIELKISNPQKICIKMIINKYKIFKYRRFKFQKDYLIMEQVIFGPMKF